MYVMKTYIRFVLFFSIFVFSFKNAWASHLRAGEITARRISNTTLTYRVTLTTYTDEINGRAANDGENEVNFYFGLSSSQIITYKVARKSKIQISASTVVNTYDTVFTFPAPSTYTISCGIINRNANTINLPAPTDQISFFVQSRLYINASIGLNSTPVLLNIPVDSAAVGTRYIHNPGAFDVDGDSLSYKIITEGPRKDKGDATGIGEFISGYLSPETVGTSPIQNEEKSGLATFTMNPRTGDLIWDAPQKAGQYNVAFVIEEWRRGINGDFLRIGEIIRDMQIIVVETKNKRPKLTMPADVCVEAGQIIDFQVTADDPDENQKLKITSSGGVYNFDLTGNPLQNIAEKAATYSPINANQNSPAKVNFKWETNCQHVRQQEYDVLFKVEDFPGRGETQLADIKTVKIKILPPRPKGLVAREKDNQLELTWQPFPNCTNEGEIIVYRREGCSGLTVGQCTTGMPTEWGYKEIGRVTTKDTVFYDKNTTKGVPYSYRLVADIAVNPFTVLSSSPSTEVCIGSELPKNVPILTNITIDKTSTTEGEITVKWTRPFPLIDTTFYKKPYQYKLYRATGLNGENFELIHTQNTSLTEKTLDTLFIDKKINTQENAYRYKLDFLYETDKLMGTTPPASSVRLLVAPDDKRTLLSWEANVPWSNDNQTHRVYRKTRKGDFNRIADVVVSEGGTFRYIDTGEDKFLEDGNDSRAIENDSTYCYKVETVGSYEKAEAIGVLMNFSQEFCATPADRSPPCSPILTLNQIDCSTIQTEQYCNESFFQNKLTWQMPTSSATSTSCRQDIVKYNVYYGRYENDALKLIGTTDGKTETKAFSHQKETEDGFAGCYYVTAVSSLGIESLPSNKICVDNCTKIEFPNVFSPNNDGTNDTFSAMNCPAFIKQIELVVYNRYGAVVYKNTSNTLAWNGTNTAGNELSAGTYYYLINVQFNELKQTSQTFTFKGWVDIIR